MAAKPVKPNTEWKPGMSLGIELPDGTVDVLTETDYNKVIIGGRVMETTPLTGYRIMVLTN